MKRPVSDIAFTRAVKDIQVRQGSRESYAKMEERGGWTNRIVPDMAAFIGERDSFYLAGTIHEIVVSKCEIGAAELVLAV